VLCHKQSLIEDLIKVQMGEMSQMEFCEKWDVPFIWFSALCYKPEEEIDKLKEIINNYFIIIKSVRKFDDRETKKTTRL